MTYYEERVVKAEAVFRYVEEGFLRSVGSFAECVLGEHFCSADEISQELDKLLLGYEALKDLRDDLERAKESLERDRERAKESEAVIW